MQDKQFFARGTGITLAHLAQAIGATLSNEDVGAIVVSGIAPLDQAGASDVSFFDNPKYADDLAATKAAVVIVSARHRPLVPASTPTLVSNAVLVAFGEAGRVLFPAAAKPLSATRQAGISGRAEIHPSARLEADVTIEPFAVIGPDCEIGRATRIGAGTVVAAGCRIGRHCAIMSNVTISHALIGDQVVIHAGVRIGQDGFGYTSGSAGLMKSVQIGRVIIQDHVEIGANSTVDRGAIRDTTIGEGTKIDNQVQIAHNVRIGRHCAIAAQVGLAGSVNIGDGVQMGGQSGANSHSKIGAGARIAGTASVASDVPPRGRWGGTPAKPIRQWFRELTTLSEIARKAPSRGTEDER